MLYTANKIFLINPISSKRFPNEIGFFFPASFNSPRKYPVVPRTIWEVRVRTDEEVLILTFDHYPSDDEIVTQLPDPVDVTPTDVAKRRALILERAGYWLTLSQAATAASSDPAFTAGERTRLNALRDAARTALRAVL